MATKEEIEASPVLKRANELGNTETRIKSEQIYKSKAKAGFCYTLYKNTYNVGELGKQERYVINLSKYIPKQKRWITIHMFPLELPFLKALTDETLDALIRVIGQKVDFTKETG